MELNHLKYFYYVVQTGSFTKAAQALRINQPGVSKAVAQLERVLGVTLLERHKRKVFLTKVGQEIYRKCEIIFHNISQISFLAEGEQSSCKGPLAFCASEPIASHIIPEINESYLKIFPEVIPSTFCGTATHLVDKISGGDFEFGLFFHVPDLGQDFEIKKLALIPFELVIATASASDRKIRTTFIGSREVDDIKAKKFPTLERIKKKVPEIKICISTNSLTAHKQMVLKGMGISILPRYLVAQELASGQLKRLHPQEKFEFALKLVLRKHKSLSRNAQTWLEHLTSWVQSQAY